MHALRAQVKLQNCKLNSTSFHFSDIFFQVLFVLFLSESAVWELIKMLNNLMGNKTVRFGFVLVLVKIVSSVQRLCNRDESGERSVSVTKKHG